MAFYDWNHNGKKDIVDNMIEYQIYRNATGKNKDTSDSHCYTGSSGSTNSPIIVFLGFFAWILILAAVGSLLGPDKKSTSSSSYKGSSYSSGISSRATSYSYSTSTPKPTSSYDSTDAGSSYDNYSSSSSSSNSNPSSSSSYSSYDEGYDDVYMDGDYDYDRYETDSDYAEGVEDAIDEDEEEEW